MQLLCWIAQGITAAILLQTLFFKFTGAPESIHIFETVGMEPLGRYGSGVAELIAAVLLFVPGFQAFGALMTIGVLSGALYFHLIGGLGIEVLGDGGLLFALAVTAFLLSLLVLFLRRGQVLRYLK